MSRARTTTPESFPRRDWTDAETERFARMYPTSTTTELVNAFRRSPSSLFQKASVLGLRKRQPAATTNAACQAAPDRPAAETAAAAVVIGITPTSHGTKTVYRNPAGGTVTRHTMK